MIGRTTIRARRLLALFLLVAAISLPRIGLAFHFPWDQGHDTCQPEQPPDTPDTCDKCNSNPSPYVVATGAYIAHRVDISIPGRVSLEIVRTYHSRDRHNGMFGYGWMFNYGVKLVEVTDGLQKLVIVRRPDGHRDRLVQNADGTYTNPVDVFDVLTRNGNATWSLIKKDGAVFTFDSAGNLIAVVDRNGNRLALTYDATGALSAVTDDSGRSLVIAKGANGKIESITDPINRIVRYAYDATGNLTSVTDARGAVTRYTYDAIGNLTSTIDPAGNIVTSAAYESSGRLASYMENGITYTLAHTPASRRIVETSSTGNTRTILYNSNGNITSKSDHLGNIEAFAYDANANPSRITDKNGNATNYEYNAQGNPIKKTDALGNVTTYTYGLQSDQPTKVVENGRTTDFQYDARGNVIEEKVTAGLKSRIWTYTYDARGQLLTADGPRIDVNDVTAFSYDAYGNVATITNALGQITKMFYDLGGQLSRLEEPNGLVTIYTYDGAGNEISRDVNGEVTRSTYNSRGFLESVTFPNGMANSYTYDLYGRVTDVLDNDGNRIHSTLDANGNAVKEETFNSASVLTQRSTFEYDKLNRRTKEIGATGQTVTHSYDANGNRLTTTDPLARVTKNSYDSLNRLVKVTDPANGQTLYEYDPLGNLRRVTDPLGNSTQYAVDGFGHTESESSPESGVKTRKFDAAGNITEETDARGLTTQFEYNGLGLRTRTAYGDGSEEARTYVPGAVDEGRLASITDPHGSISWTYESHDRVASRTQVVGGVTLALGHAYDAQGRLTQLTYPSGRNLRFEYDAAGKVISLKMEQQTLISQISYQPFGHVSGWKWGNGATYIRAFNLDGNLVNFPLGSDAQTIVYDAARRITGINGSTSNSYGYDSLDRLTSVSAPGRTQAYTYDANSNRRSKTEGGQTTTYGYATNSSRLLSRTQGATVNYAYDAAGNITADGARTFLYDARGRMSQVTSGNLATTYRYNGLGQRVAKTAPGSSVVSLLYVYDDQGHLLGIYDGSGTTIIETVYLHDTPVATVSGNGLIHYIHADQLDTPRVITNIQNGVVWRWDSDPFGVGLPNNDPDGDGTQFAYNLRFPGQHFDDESGLHYNYFRDYDATLGRYMQIDPIGLQGGLNLYLYANANPVGFADPTGEIAPVAAAIVIRAAIAAAWRALQAAIARCAGNPVCRCRAFYAAYKVMCGVPCKTCSTPSVACCAITTAEAAAAAGCVTLRAAYIGSRCDIHIPTTKDHPGALAQAQRALVNCSAHAALMCKCLL